MESNVWFFSMFLFFPGVSLFSLALHIVLSGFREAAPAKVYFGGLVYFYCLVMLYTALKVYFLPVWSFRTFFEADLLILLMELPFVYMYIRLLMKPEDRFLTHLIKHQLPFLVLLGGLVIIRMCTVSNTESVSLLAFFQNFQGIEDFFLLVCMIVFIVQFSCYALSVVHLVKNYKERVGRIPGLKPVQLRWVYVIIILLTAFTVVFVYYIFSVSELSRLIVAILAFALLNSAAICGGLHRNVLVQFSYETDIPLPDEKNGDESVEERILQGLITLFEQQHIYREFDLHLEDVAARVGSNRTYVSAVINNRYRINFYRFVNGYRIREAQQLMFTTSEPIHEIACVVGFKSISTFNYQFKEYAGMSPKEWRTAIRNDMKGFVKSGASNC